MAAQKAATLNAAINSAINSAINFAIKSRADCDSREKYSQGDHAPKGGVTIGGQFFRGGEFIPASVMAKATSTERAAIEGKTKGTRSGFEAINRPQEQVVNKKGKQISRAGSAQHADPSQGQLSGEIRDRVAKMKLPPAWVGVQVAIDPKSPLQAIGFDAKGRQQRRYSAEHSAKQDVEKFSRVKSFIGMLPKIREKLSIDMQSSDPMVREAAAAISLIDKTGFRVGSEKDTGAEKKAHGATTLDASHVVVSGDKVTFAFVGKKGVDIHQTIEDSALARMIEGRKLRGGKLFDTNDVKVRNYLHSIAGNFKVKDFRTAVAGESALSAMAGIPSPKTAKEYEQKRLEVGKIVSQKLGNTPKVALDSYIPPEVFGSWQSSLLKMVPVPKINQPASTDKATKAGNARNSSSPKLSPSASRPQATTESPTTQSSSTKTTKTNSDAVGTVATSGGIPRKSAAYSLSREFNREFYSRGMQIVRTTRTSIE